MRVISDDIDHGDMEARFRQTPLLSIVSTFSVTAVSIWCYLCMVGVSQNV